ncbi:guanosine-3',5'-bis(diphosphate) 3'-pyrophosphohydrolase MESH1-like [Polypterus senegalus]|uniref:guanosine-3',5'-bis(diphosphate) 3'-pyrophosphohydrolase MESH1-like n=1 Tax=Polypterus senegalus TaxID=55291 RepID=UPI0019629C5A|nr:guanosine-3',5'-bis(diphosphate) 3'-pyrophosphohydrolase MESH1-like [Polypterus senegalus]
MIQSYINKCLQQILTISSLIECKTLTQGNGQTKSKCKFRSEKKMRRVDTHCGKRYPGFETVQQNPIVLSPLRKNKIPKGRKDTEATRTSTTPSAALLHDTVEDTETSFDELDGKFGATVARIVQEVTDDKMLPKQERKQQQILKAPLCSHQAKLVKLADKLYNLRDLNRSTPVGWSEQRVQEYFIWAAQVIKGLRGTSATLEEKLNQLFKERGIEM